MFLEGVKNASALAIMRTEIVGARNFILSTNRANNLTRQYDWNDEGDNLFGNRK